MNYQLLGKSGLRVSELCLGTMTFGEEWGWGSNKDESKLVFDAYVKAGGNFLDTADGYTNGTSEKMVGEFIRTTGAMNLSSPPSFPSINGPAIRTPAATIVKTWRRRCTGPSSGSAPITLTFTGCMRGMN